MALSAGKIVKRTVAGRCRQWEGGTGRGGGEHQVCQAGTGIRHVPGLSGRARCARRCEENMTVCASYWADGPPRNGSLESLTPVWPSKEACCQAGAGAYVNGDRLASLLP